MPQVGGGDYLPSKPHPPVHHGASHYGSPAPTLPGGEIGDDQRLSSGGVPPPTPSSQRILSPSLSSSPPPSSDYSSRQMQSQQQQQQQQHLYHQHPHLQSGVPSLIPSGPLNGGVNGMVDGGYTVSLPSSMPWTVGITDGSFATMRVMQQQQQRNNQSPTEGELLGTNPIGENIINNNAGAAIGAAGEANASNSHTKESSSNNDDTLAALFAIQAGKSLYHDRLFNQSSSSVESVLASSCDVMGFDIAEMWLRTGPKTHQLTNSHLRPTALEDSVRMDLVEVYYGEKSNERTHRLSPALCKRAKDANDVVWVTAHTQHGAEALRMSISNVRTAVAVPVCHEASNTNITIIYFSIRRYVSFGDKRLRVFDDLPPHLTCVMFVVVWFVFLGSS